MTRQRLILAGVALLAMAGSFGAGRMSARQPAVKDQRTVAAATKASATKETHAAETTRAVATSDVDTTTRVVTRWLPAVPATDGCPAIPAHVEQEATTERHAATTRTSEGRRASSELAKQEAQTQQTVVESHTVTPAPSPRLFLMALPGVQVADRPVLGLPGHLAIGGAVGYRIGGPVMLGAWGSTAGGGSGGAVLGLTF